MERNEVKAIFDNQAATYDKQWARMAPLRDCMHFLLESVFAELPFDARILCVGAGTGTELALLARLSPHWRFTAVDPSGPMLEVCLQRAKAEGFRDRVKFHEGYVETLPPGEPFDAATCFLVSQFILDVEARRGFFRDIAARLKAGAVLASSDLASDTNSPEFDALLRTWFRTMAKSLDPARLEQMRAAYARDVSVLPPAQVASLIASAGFEMPTQFFQGGMIHAWFAKRA